MRSWQQLWGSLGRPRDEERGLTLVELLVTTAVVGVIAAGILGLYLSSVKVAASEQYRMYSQDDARLAINQVSRYVRAMADSAANQSTQSDALAYAGTGEIVFYCDVDGNNISDKVRYYVDGNALKMQTVAPNTGSNPPTYPAYTGTGIIIQQGVATAGTPLFTYFYYSQPHNQLLQFTTPPTSAADLRSVVAVGLDLTVNEQPKLSPSGIRLQTVIQIRQRYNGDLQQ